MSEPFPIIRFKETMQPIIKELIQISSTFEGTSPLREMALLVELAFDHLTALMMQGLFEDKPLDEMGFLSQQPYSEDITKIEKLRNENRNSPYFNHLSTISESILALNWIALRPSPKTFVNDMCQAAEFYGNRVLTTNKKSTNHSAFINKYLQLLRELEGWIKEFFVTGFTWGSAKGGPLPMTVVINSPPPPPPPPATPIFKTDESTTFSDAQREALLADLNKGEAITHCLRPAKERLKTNTQSVPKQRQTASTAQTFRAEPKFQLDDGRRWTVAHQYGKTAMTLDNDMNHSLLMFDCEDCSLTIPFKISNVVIENCRKINMVINNVISSVEIIRSKRVQIQCDGFVPLISISSSEEVNVFVNEKSKAVEVVAARSTSLNITVVKEDGDCLELPIPEQIKCVISGNNKLKSTVLENM